MDDMVPSPFWGKDMETESVRKDIEKLAAKYGFDKFLFCLGKPNPEKEDTTDWTVESNNVSDGMVKLLGKLQDDMEEHMDKLLEDNEEDNGTDR